MQPLSVNPPNSNLLGTFLDPITETSPNSLQLAIASSKYSNDYGLSAQLGNFWRCQGVIGSLQNFGLAKCELFGESAPLASTYFHCYGREF